MTKDISKFQTATEWLANALGERDRTAQLLDLVASPIWISDVEGTIVFANRRWHNLVMSSPSNQHGLCLSTVLFPTDVDRFAMQLGTYRGLRRRFDIEVSLINSRQEGQLVCMEIEPLLSDDGDVDGWIGTCTEGNSNSHLTRKLEEKQEFLDALLENLSDGIVACNSDGVLTLFNRATREFHGLPKEPIPPEDWANHYDLYRADASTPMEIDDIPLFRALRGESVKNAEMAIAPKHGRQRFVLANGDPIVTKDGRQLGAVVAMRDITTQRQAELQLLESQNRYRLLAENLQDLLVEHATDGVIRYASASALNLIGYSNNELVGQSLLSLMHPDDATALRQTTVSGLAAIPSRAQYRIRHIDGFYRWFESSSSVVTDDIDSDRKIVISVLRDITDRKQFEAAICELNETLEARVDQRTEALEQANLDIQSLFEREQTALARLTRSEQEYRS
ncbi:MAG: PAS domain-containing protein, partial [Cyanobacteria bacterium P01_E01_bin.34]